MLMVVAMAAFMLVARPQPVSAACTDFACTGCTNPKIDLVCQRNRLLDPNSKCTLLYCGDNGGTSSTPGNQSLNVNFFGVTIKVETDKQVATLIYVLFSFFLGAVAIAVTVLGVYGAYLRSKAESADDIAKSTKLLTNVIIGLILIVVSLVIAQLVASFLGIQSLDKLVDFSGIFKGG